MRRRRFQPRRGNCNIQFLKCSCDYGEVLTACRRDDFHWKQSVYTFFRLGSWTSDCSWNRKTLTQFGKFLSLETVERNLSGEIPGILEVC
ncbi:hypothetical protein AMELA_G00087330 [Ameiurus melas]|uniref:Uncharacterized protein n=1 Tax=Ameiurus melas TaxID=219545 RepID=A0A7J6AX12_AMEME|nr:hypothetical protein AMELA_G00087330 [Ameiurus melas]